MVRPHTDSAFPAPAWCNDRSVPLPSDVVELFADFHSATREVEPRVLLVCDDTVLVPLYGASAVTFLVPPQRRVRFLTDEIGHSTIAPAPKALRC